MDEAAIARNAACDAAVWALYRLGALDDDALERWLRAAWSKLTPWRDQPPSFAVSPRPYELEGPVWAPPDTREQAAHDAARAAKAAMTARIDRVLSGGPDRHDGLAIIALVVHAEAISLHFHYLGRAAAQIAPFEQQSSRDTPDEALGPLTPPPCTRQHRPDLSAHRPGPRSCRQRLGATHGGPSPRSHQRILALHPRRITTRPHLHHRTRREALDS